MNNRFDYDEQELMSLLSNASSEEEQKSIYNSYQEKKLSERKDAIISKLKEYAMANPMITQEKYISLLNKYTSYDLQTPFESIINAFDNEMKEEYSKYVESEKAKETIPTPVETPAAQPTIEPTPVAPVAPEVNITPAPTEEAPVNIEINPSVSEEDINPDVPFANTVDANPFFDENQKEVAPNDSNDGQKGNANAIIISIITIIIGIVIMYSIIRLK